MYLNVSNLLSLAAKLQKEIQTGGCKVSVTILYYQSVPFISSRPYTGYNMSSDDQFGAVASGL